MITLEIRIRLNIMHEIQSLLTEESKRLSPRSFPVTSLDRGPTLPIPFLCSFAQFPPKSHPRGSMREPGMQPQGLVSQAIRR